MQALKEKQSIFFLILNGIFCVSGCSPVKLWRNIHTQHSDLRDLVLPAEMRAVEAGLRVNIPEEGGPQLGL